MPLTFKGSADPTIGVEVEYQIVDCDSMSLVSAAPRLLELFPGERWVKPEILQCMLELNTGICGDVREVRRDLEGKIASVREAAERLGLALAAAGTHPFARWRDQKVTVNERYFRLVETVEWPARRMQIFGLHVHIGVPDGETAIAVINHLEGWLPHLLALSASSPFWQGDDTGLASSRIKVFEGLPTAGLPHRHRDWAEFTCLMEALVAAKAIESIREVWWDLRPHPDFGTVEVRICDALPTLDETVAVAALVQALIVHLQRQIGAGASAPLLHRRIVDENKWRAARWGTAGSTIVDERGRVEPIAESISRLLERLEPLFEELGSAGELPRLRELIRRPSHARQRAVFRESGDLRRVARSLVRELAENKPSSVPLRV
jgi:carboxylate-amine ligase